MATKYTDPLHRVPDITNGETYKRKERRERQKRREEADHFFKALQAFCAGRGVKVKVGD